MLGDLNEIKPSIAVVEGEPGRRYAEQNLLDGAKQTLFWKSNLAGKCSQHRAYPA